MNRAVDCLIDIDCLQEISLAPSIQTVARPQHNGPIHLLTLWHERSRQRRELRELAQSPDLLKDTNLDFYEVRREGKKPFWRK